MCLSDIERGCPVDLNSRWYRGQLSMDQYDANKDMVLNYFFCVCGPNKHANGFTRHERVNVYSRNHFNLFYQEILGSRCLIQGIGFLSRGLRVFFNIQSYWPFWMRKCVPHKENNNTFASITKCSSKNIVSWIPVVFINSWDSDSIYFIIITNKDNRVAFLIN